MDKDTRLDAMARWLWQARQRRLPYRNLPDELRPASIAEAYAAQEAYYRLAEPVLGAVGGAKIATTTKVMQQLMGITHPCGGAIFSRTIHRSPAKLRAGDFVNLRIESEIGDLNAGMVIITGSLIATVSIAAGQQAVFTVDGLGETVMDVL